MKTNDLRHQITVFSDNGKTRTKIKIRLNDECRNGHEDFSITADVDEKEGRGLWRDSMSGCCHEHILSLKPELAPFVALHLSSWQGVPMHSASNAWYWFQGAFPEAASSKYHGGTGSSAKTPEECRAIFAGYIRATPEQVEAIAALLPRSQDELQAAIEDLAFPEQWQREARAAIRQLESWTSVEFESKATRGFWEPLAAEKRQLIAERRASGYYLPENVAKRDAEERKARRGRRVSDLKASHAAKLAELRQDHAFAVWCAENYDEKPNAIRYSDGRITANWTSTEKLFTRDAWEDFTRCVPAELFDSPPVFVFQERPKY